MLRAFQNHLNPAAFFCHDLIRFGRVNNLDSDLFSVRS
jgi:hypothetical protein